MVEWFLPLFPSWCTNHWYFSGEVGKLSHCYTTYSCTLLAVELSYELLAVGLLERLKFVQVRFRQEQLPVQHYLCLQLEDWRQGQGIDWEVDQVKTELIWDSESTFGFSWVNACIKCPGFSLKCPTENYLCHNDSSTQEWCRQDAWSGVSGFSWEEEKGLTGG